MSPNPIPTGKIVPTDEGRDLVLTREFTAPIEDVWASITESERTARWFGPWTGDGRPGGVVRYTMLHEAGEPQADLTIDACEAPHRLAVSSDDDYGSWSLELLLSHDNGVTTLTFVHHLDDSADASSIGPGWEYYLDALVASREGGPKPSFDDYYPAQSAYYSSTA